MKRVITVLLILSVAQGTYSQTTSANAVADKIATKMRDTLNLTISQTEQIYQINLQLQESKSNAWQRYSGMDSIRIAIQNVERTRDSLYRQVLPPEKYLVYINKKRFLISAN